MSGGLFRIELPRIIGEIQALNGIQKGELYGDITTLLGDIFSYQVEVLEAVA